MKKASSASKEARRQPTVFKPFRSVVIASAAISWFYGIMPLKRNVFWAFHYALTPLAFLFFIYLYGGSESVSFALAGGLVMVTVSVSIALETEAAFNRLILRLQEIYVSSPIPPFAYVIGLAISNGVYAIPGLIIFLGLTAYFIGLNFITLATIILALTLAWTSFSTIGFIISTKARDLKDLWTWSPIISMAASFLPPVFYPLEVLPEALRWVVYIIPTAIASRLIQSSFGVVSIALQEWMALWIALTLHAALAVTALLKRMKWRET